MSAAVKADESYVKTVLEEAAKRAPEPYKGYIIKVTPVLVGVADFLDKLWPHIANLIGQAFKFYAYIEPYHPEQYVPLIAGLAMCFFGGSYLLLVAAIEAVRMSAWDKVKSSTQVLYSNAKKALEAKKKDDTVDANNDGIPDVLQITKKERLSRVVIVIGGAVDPEECSAALNAMWTCFLSVIATLRIRFAQCLTLGASLAQLVQRNAGEKVEKFVLEILPPEVKKWAPRLTTYLFAFAGFLLAWMMQRLIGGFHCAMRGGQLAVQHGVKLAKKRGLIAEDAFDEKSNHATMAAMALGGLGFLWQLRNGFAVPFPLSAVFLPATILEWFLEIFVSFGM